jgi:chromosome segregation ATPase
VDGLQVAGYAAAVQAAVAGAVWIGKKLTTHKVTEADREAERDEWFRRKLDESQSARDTERSDCTGKIDTLRADLDSVKECLDDAVTKLDDCKRQHSITLEQRAQDISDRHRINRELRTLTAKYTELREIVDVIETIPPPPATILRKQQP